MTPPRLSEIECPECHGRKWIIDSDFRGASLLGGGVELRYSERTYHCRGCGREGVGWTVRQQAPVDFLLQQNLLHEMLQVDSDHWEPILRAHFPNYPLLARLGMSFVSHTPEEVAAQREAFELANPVGQMRDQDGTCRLDPDWPESKKWFGVMKPGDFLIFLRRDGGQLEIKGPSDDTFSVRYTDTDGRVIKEAAGLDPGTVLQAISRYLQGLESLNQAGSLSL